MGYPWILQIGKTQLKIQEKKCLKVVDTFRSRLYQDLGADGTDAYELMVKLKEDFEVDMTNFVFENHFGAEHGFNPLVWIFWLLFEREKLNDKGAVKKIPITVLDLYESAKIKKWPEVGDKKPE